VAGDGAARVEREPRRAAAVEGAHEGARVPRAGEGLREQDDSPLRMLPREPRDRGRLGPAGASERVEGDDQRPLAPYLLQKARDVAVRRRASSGDRRHHEQGKERRGDTDAAHTGIVPATPRSDR
jgi:hypothetical protein